MSIVTALQNQFERGWRMIDATIDATSEDAWTHAGRGYLAPARLAYHIAETVDFYTADTEEFPFGDRFGGDWEALPAAELPSREDAKMYLGEMQQKMHDWLGQFDDETILGANTRHSWCGGTVLELAVYVLRHNLHHHGAMNALAVLTGSETDNWA